MGVHPIYRYRCETMTGIRDILVFNPGVGAPLAVLLTECIIAAGVRNLIACGGCGVLNPEIMANHPVIITSAVRDEGTSYHYLNSEHQSVPHLLAVAALEAT